MKLQRVVVDDSAAKTLVEPADAVQVCTESGQIIGYFTPACDPNGNDELDHPCSNEELRDRLREGGGRPLADILHDLENPS